MRILQKENKYCELLNIDTIMKKILLFCLVFAASLVCYKLVKSIYEENKATPTDAVEQQNEVAARIAQEDSLMQNSTHLKFKGVPIDGSLNTFVDRMRRSGFKSRTYSSGRATLAGDFADFRNCIVVVETLSGKNLVSKVSVHFPCREKWVNLEQDYKHLKSLLTEKYGKPSSCAERFKPDEILGYPKSDSDKHFAISDDRCNYTTTFKRDNGTIVLKIKSTNYSDCFVALSYEDKENSNAVRAHAIQDL